MVEIAHRVRRDSAAWLAGSGAFALAAVVWRQVLNEELAASWSAIPSQVALGLVALAPLVLTRKRPLQLGAAAVLLAIVFTQGVAFHYEALFARLPSFGLLYYLGQSEHLSPSLQHASPLWRLVVESVVVATVSASAMQLSRRLQPRPAMLGIVAAVAMTWTAVVHVAPGVLPERFFWSSRVPAVWWLQSATVSGSYDIGEHSISPESVWQIQRRLGHRLPAGGSDADYPLCTREPPAATSATGRSVIMIVLESVGRREIYEDFEGAPLMPRLRAIAERETSFPRAFAGGTKSSQALPSLFAGLPPQTAANIMWRVPLPSTDGYPRRLRNAGYQTAYLHGSDLAFEQQRSFLRRAGFTEIIEWSPRDPTPRYGWGWSDDHMLGRLRLWAQAHREAPYLATLFTLSSHHPFALPPSWTRRLLGDDDWSRYRESLAYLDHHLAEFFTWYQAEERPRGTVLMIVGDHAPQLIRGAWGEPSTPHLRFDVPLIVAGDGLPRGRQARLASHHDVPATLAGLTGIAVGRCDQGVDLMSDDHHFDPERWVYAVGGDEREEIYGWSADGAFRLDRRRGDIRASSPELADDARRFTDALLPLSFYLVSKNAFAPDATPKRRTQGLGPVARSLFISHRGQTSGELAASAQNRLARLADVRRSGFDGVEFDLQITADNEVVLLHDSTTADGRAVVDLELAQLRALPGLADVATLDQLADEHARWNSTDEPSGRDGPWLMLEAKPQPQLGPLLKLAGAIAEFVREQPDRVRNRIVVDSFQLDLAEAIKPHCDCQVGLDAPLDTPITDAWLRAVADADLDWVYVDENRASPQLVTRIHDHGLRVLVYTVNDPALLRRLSASLPDAVITDRADIIPR